MSLVANWRRVLLRAWSVRLILLAAFLDAASVALSVFADSPPIARGWFAGLSAAVTLGAAIARIVAQPSITGEAE